MMTQKIAFTIAGTQTIHCPSCEARIARALKRVPGVEEVEARAETQEVAVVIDPSQVSAEHIRDTLTHLGYQVGREA